MQSKHQIAKDFIGRSFREAYKPNWPKELKLFYQLLKQYPDLDFWENFEMPFPLRSLAFLKSERGQEVLRENYNKYKYQQREPKKVEAKKQKTFADYLSSIDKSATVPIKKRITKKQFLKQYAQD